MSLTAAVDCHLLDICIHCLLGSGGKAVDPSSISLIVTAEALELFRFDGTYGSCFSLRSTDFLSYVFAGAEAELDDGRIVLALDRSDLQRCSKYATKLGARQIEIVCSRSALLMRATASNGHLHEQGFLLLNTIANPRRRLMPIEDATAEPIGFCQTEYVSTLRGQLDHFRLATLVEMSVWPTDQQLGITLSAENGKRVARWPLNSAYVEATALSTSGSCFFSGYDVRQEVMYSLSNNSVTRVLQALSTTPVARAVRIEFYEDALKWLVDVAGNSAVTAIYVRHDIPKMRSHER